MRVCGITNVRTHKYPLCAIHIYNYSMIIIKIIYKDYFDKINTYYKKMNVIKKIKSIKMKNKIKDLKNI